MSGARWRWAKAGKIGTSVSVTIKMKLNKSVKNVYETHEDLMKMQSSSINGDANFSALWNTL